MKDVSETFISHIYYLFHSFIHEDHMYFSGETQHIRFLSVKENVLSNK